MSYQGPEDPTHHEGLPPAGPPADFPPPSPPPGSMDGQPAPTPPPYTGAPGAPAAYGAGPPPPGSGQWGYAQPGYQMPIDHPQGTTILVLGIVGFVVCPVTAPIAWIMGNTAIKEVDAEPWRYGNRSTIQAGRYIGMGVTILYGLFLLLMALFLVALMVGLGANS